VREHWGGNFYLGEATIILKGGKREEEKKGKGPQPTDAEGGGNCGRKKIPSRGNRICGGGWGTKAKKKGDEGFLFRKRSFLGYDAVNWFRKGTPNLGKQRG